MGQILEFKGVVKNVSAPKVSEKNGKTYESVTIVIEEQNEQYPSSVAFSVLNKPEEVAKCKVGSEIKAKINLKANEFNGSWFTNLNVWTIEVLQQKSSQANNDLPY